jgi:hypothetical protein
MRPDRTVSGKGLAKGYSVERPLERARRYHWLHGVLEAYASPNLNDSTESFRFSYRTILTMLNPEMQGKMLVDS